MKREAKDTRIHLVQEIEKLISAGYVQRTPAIDYIIAEAKAGEYHDFKNQKYACGKVEVVDKLRAVGLMDLAHRVIQGEFDEVPDAEDEAEIGKILKGLFHDKSGAY